MIDTPLEKAKRFLSERSCDYKVTFDKEKRSAHAVLRDLAVFCRANETTFHADPRIHAVLEGRREVFLRIAHHLNLTTDELWSIYGNPAAPLEN